MPTNKCLFCSAGNLHREVRPEEYEYKGFSITVDQPGEYCDSCGEAVLHAQDLKATRRAIHDLHARGNGLLTSGEIRRVRTSLSLTQAEAGQRFGGGANAFSRYERGETMQPRSLDQLFRTLDMQAAVLKKVVKRGERVLSTTVSTSSEAFAFSYSDASVYITAEATVSAHANTVDSNESDMNGVMPSNHEVCLISVDGEVYASAA